MSNKSTANKNVYGQEVCSKKAAAFDLTPHLVALMWDEPFYSRIIRSLNKKESTDIETAGVLCDDGVLNFWWNRNFLASLSKQKIKGLLKHECLHLVFCHTTSRRKDPHIIWNWATDLAINSLIPKNELPKGGLIPGEPLPKLSKEEMSRLSQEEIENHNKISNLIASLPKEKTSEFYYYELMSNDTMKEMAPHPDKFQIVFGSGMDDHQGWDDLNDSEREMVAEKIKEIMRSAAEEADQKGWGSVSARMRQKIRTAISNKVPWQSVLKRFCGFSNRQNKENTVTRLNRKYPLIHPGSKYEYKSTIAVYIDESGSVSNKHLETFYGELNSLSKVTDFWLYKFDTNVNDKEGFLWKKGKKINLNRSQCGGTCFQAPTDHANANKDIFDGYIIFTDGMAPEPSFSKVKRGWLLTPDGSLAFDKSNRDILIKFN